MSKPDGLCYLAPKKDDYIFINPKFFVHPLKLLP